VNSLRETVVPVDDYTPRRGEVVVFHADQWLPEADALCAIVPFAVTVPAGKLWLLGDNRENSLDSAAQSMAPNQGFVDQPLVVAVYEPDVED
jgi:hypothetical protein